LWRFSAPPLSNAYSDASSVWSGGRRLAAGTSCSSVTNWNGGLYYTPTLPAPPASNTRHFNVQATLLVVGRHRHGADNNAPSNGRTVRRVALDRTSFSNIPFAPGHHRTNYHPATRLPSHRRRSKHLAFGWDGTNSRNVCVTFRRRDDGGVPLPTPLIPHWRYA